MRAESVRFIFFSFYPSFFSSQTRTGTYYAFFIYSTDNPHFFFQGKDLSREEVDILQAQIPVAWEGRRIILEAFSLSHA